MMSPLYIFQLLLSKKSSGNPSSVIRLTANKKEAIPFFAEPSIKPHTYAYAASLNANYNIIKELY